MKGSGCRRFLLMIGEDSREVADEDKLDDVRSKMRDDDDFQRGFFLTKSEFLSSLNIFHAHVFFLDFFSFAFFFFFRLSFVVI